MKFNSYGPSGPNTASTSSPSFLRSKPWSTNTHVNWLPIAFDNNTAATEESTPPLRAHKTFPSPTFSRIALICSSTKLSILQSPQHPQTPRTKLYNIFEPSCVCNTSGWN